MRIRRGACVLLLCGGVLSLVAVRVYAADEESLGRQAEQGGNLREALTLYVAALQAATEASPQEQTLREKIIGLALKLNPASALPEEAIAHEGRAEAALRTAQSQQDYLEAIGEYKEALRLAPWHAADYFNLGLVYEKAGLFREAMQSLRYYLLAAPQAADAVEVKKRIASLEYQVEKEVKTKMAAQAQDVRDRDLALRLAGTWEQYFDYAYITLSDGRQVENRGNQIKIQTDGNKVYAELSGVAGMDNSQSYFFYREQHLPYFNAELKEGRLAGTINELSFDLNNFGYLRITGAYAITSSQVNEDGRFITLAYTNSSGEEIKQQWKKID